MGHSWRGRPREVSRSAQGTKFKSYPPDGIDPRRRGGCDNPQREPGFCATPRGFGATMQSEDGIPTKSVAGTLSSCLCSNPNKGRRAEAEGTVTVIRKPTRFQGGALTWRRIMVNSGQPIDQPRIPRIRPTPVWDGDGRFEPTVSPWRGAVAGFANSAIESRNHIRQRSVHGCGRRHPRLGT